MKKENEQEVVKDLELGAGFSMAVAAFPVFPMLCGLSLELMYKAICVAKSINFNKEHNLPKLCKLAEVPATEEEYQFLALFTESVVWEGKYPVPTEKRKDALESINDLWSTLLYEEVKEIKGIKFKRYNGRLSWETFNILWDKACSAFYEMNS